MKKKHFAWIFAIALFEISFSTVSLNKDLSVTSPLSKADSKTEGLDLGQKFQYYGSDKDVNGYTSIYHTLFDHLKDKPIALLEIGIGTMIPGAHSSMVGFAGTNYKPGGSLRAWRDYFVNGAIYGIDVQPDTQFNDEPRIKTYLFNTTDKTKTMEFMKSLGDIKFDIIIDDGSHIDTDQLKTLSNFYPYLKDNGYYIIEDIYPNSSVSNRPQEVSSLSNNDPCFFVGVKNNICVIHKNHLKRSGATYNY